MQELIWQIKPDLIIETGIAHGGSLIFSASMLTLLDYCDAAEQGKTLAPKTAMHQYIKTHPEFEIDKLIDHKLPSFPTNPITRNGSNPRTIKKWPPAANRCSPAYAMSAPAESR